MKFILFRHAHKGIIPFEDPELSLQGFEQSARILSLIQTGQLPAPTHLLASPKRRTSQTLYPSAKDRGIKIEIKSELDQHQNHESLNEFKKRITSFLESLNTFDASAVVYACTHYDWIEEAMPLINCDKDLSSFEFLHWSPTQHVIFEHVPNTAGLWKFIKKGDAK